MRRRTAYRTLLIRRRVGDIPPEQLTRFVEVQEAFRQRAAEWHRSGFKALTPAENPLKYFAEMFNVSSVGGFKDSVVEALRGAIKAGGRILLVLPYMPPPFRYVQELLSKAERKNGCYYVGNAAMRWEREIGTVKKLEGGVAGIIHIFLLSQDLGPAYFVFHYVNGTPPDEETAKRLISRYVELAGVCPSPLIVEFWPKTGVDYLIVKPDYRVFILPAVAAAVTIIVALFIARRIKKSARKG